MNPKVNVLFFDTINIAASDLHRQKLERIERNFDREFDKTKRELQWTKLRRSDTFSTPTENLDNIRIRLKNNYNQLMQVDENKDLLSRIYG
jgi:hypothetical protein